MNNEDATFELTEFDLGVLRASGFPLAVSQEVFVFSNEELFHVVGKVLHEPSARLVEAATCALLCLAMREVQTLPVERLSTPAQRRLGYLLEDLKDWSAVPSKNRAYLDGWWSLLSKKALPDASATPVGLSAAMSPGRLKRLARNPTESQARWRVFGRVELRSEVLEQVVQA